MKIYFKQALQMLRENPLVNTISILGTALSIAAILMVVLVMQVNVTEYPPESNRNKMLYVFQVLAEPTGDQPRNNGNMSSEVVRECFYSLQKPAAVTAMIRGNRAISLPNKRLHQEFSVKYTDPGFWKVFDFTFTAGAPFTEADFQSGLSRAVIAEDVAAKLFETTDVIGQTIILDFTPYTIVGVVKPVSKAASHAYSNIWVPYSATTSLMASTRSEGIAGEFMTIMLAEKRSDFNAIKEELDQRIARYNEGKRDWKLQLHHNSPSTQIDILTGGNITYYLLTTGILLLFLLLIPALNITGVIHSSMYKRRSEIGVRKAFGATQGKLVNQILYENFVITLIGGVVGLILSFFLLEACKSFMFSNEPMLTARMLIRPGLFLAALLFVLLLNLLSAGLPARKIARQQIVDALKDSDEE